jgi:hypothetical protein
MVPLISYYIQEMLAALVLFTVLFVCMAALAGALFILDRVSSAVIALIESGGKQAARCIRHCGVMPEPRAKF